VGLRRGDVVVVALQGDLGKPRPALVIETDQLAPTDYVLVCPGTTFLRPDTEPRRVLVQPDTGNGLREPTQFQIDKISVVQRSKCRQRIGSLDHESMTAVDAILLVIVGLADGQAGPRP
jgi:mRNA interferase MazF